MADEQNALQMGMTSGKQFDDGTSRFTSLDDLMRRTESKKQVQKQELADLLKKAAEKSDRVTPGQAFAMTALAAIPMIVGRHFSGRAKGATPMDAAAVGTSSLDTYTKGLNETEALQRNVYSQLAGVKEKELSGNEALSKSLQLESIRQMGAEQDDLRGHNYRMKEIKERMQLENPARTPEQISYLTKMLTGETVSKEEAAAAAADSSLYKMGIDASYKKGIDQRAEQKMDMAKAQLTLPDWEPPPGVVLPSGTVDRARKLTEGEAAFQFAGNALKDAILRGDKEGIRAAYTGMSVAQATKANTGAALSVNEEFRKMGNIPHLIETGQFSASALQAALGVDPIRQVDAALGYSGKEYDSVMTNGFGLRRKPPAQMTQAPQGTQGKTKEFTPEDEAWIEAYIARKDAASQGK